MSIMELQENRTMLGVIAIILILFAVAVFFYNRTLNDLAAGSCTDSSINCPHEKVVDTQNIVIAVLILVIALIVGWIFFQMRKKPAPEREERITVERKQTKKIDVSALDADEKRIIGILQERGGSTFQSDVVKELGYTKVKVSRLLDRLEQKGIVERKRRGMANLVVLR